MNIWLAKLGSDKFTTEHKPEIQNLLRTEFDVPDDINSIQFEYKNSKVHYLSFDISDENSQKNYNYVDTENNLTAYSGLFIGLNSTNTDYRSAESVHKYSDNPNFFDSNISGNFAVINASESKFQCFVDNLRFHKVFYFKGSDGHIYISNFIKFLRLFKKSDINKDAFLDWITLEKVLFHETEEKNIYTLPYYGIFTWSYKNNRLNINQYKDVSDIVYNNTSQKSLLENVISDFRSSAQYLSKYHKFTITLSGGYDSRLLLNMFWGLDNKNIDSYSYFDHYRDLKVAKKVANNFGIPNKTIEITEEIPSFQQLHKYLVSTNFPFFKYSQIFSYLIKDRLSKIYTDGRHGVLIKGTGGNSDRNIIGKNFLDDFKGNEAISRLTEHVLKSIDTNFFNKEFLKYFHNRLQTHYQEKYMPIIAGRGKHHKLKCLLFKEKYENTTSRLSSENQSFYSDIYWPLTMDSFQTLLFNCPEKDLHRGRKKSIYHKISNSFTQGKDKPIHFSAGLHWEASKLSRGFYRLKHNIIEKNIAKKFNYMNKKTTQIKAEFYRKNRSKAADILIDSKDSFLWDFLNRDFVIKQFQNSSNYNERNTQFIFKNILPTLKLDIDNSL